MKTYVCVAAALTALSGCQTLRGIDNPLATAYSDLDGDDDGVISSQEAQSIPVLAKNFNRIDTNSSGGIDDNEYKAATMHIADLGFEDVDINGDGVISKREAAAMPVSLKETFDDVDTDGDNNVSPTEYRAAATNLLQEVDFSTLDTDGDGVIGTTEARKLPPLAEAYERVDTDADGLISKKELAAAQR
jgi:Ca2+-binding EF-hand superfamily protein